MMALPNVLSIGLVDVGAQQGCRTLDGVSRRNVRTKIAVDLASPSTGKFVANIGHSFDLYNCMITKRLD